jgi:hypothetical protein
MDAIHLPIVPNAGFAHFWVPKKRKEFLQKKYSLNMGETPQIEWNQPGK